MDLLEIFTSKCLLTFSLLVFISYKDIQTRIAFLQEFNRINNLKD